MPAEQGLPTNHATQEKIVISDPGIDDAVALLLSAAIWPNVSLVATYGNAPTLQTSRNMVGIRDFIQRNIRDEYRGNLSQVYNGADRATGKEEPYSPDGGNLFFIHGEGAIEGQFQEFDPSETPSAVLYDSKAHQSEGFDVISLGALTELSAILQREDLEGKIKSITIMGGALFTQGNVSSHVEANFAHDPDALDIILREAKR